MSSLPSRGSETVLIDWFTVGAQALNFLILVWLLKRFLYKPVLNAIDEREKKVAAELANADQKKAEAQKESDEFKHKNEDFDRQRAGLLTQATDEARAERQRLLDEARMAAEALSSKRQEGLRNEEHNLRQAVGRRTQREVFAIARKALADLAGTSLEASLSAVFIRRLKEMDGQAKAGLAQAFKTADPVILRSAFDLPTEQRSAIQKALNETFAAEIHTRFETAPDLVSGIEATANGQKVAWSIADYLGSLEQGVDELLKEGERSQVKAATASDLTMKITKRAYELYEKGGRKSDSSGRDWSQAEQEIRKGVVKVEPKPELKAQVKPEMKAETKPDAKIEPKTEAEVKPKPETVIEPKPEVKVELKSEVKAEPEPESKIEPKPGVKAEPNPENQAEFKPEAKAAPRPETKSQ
jgi:F-type H+-transporting ATPase subunit b